MSILVKNLVSVIRMNAKCFLLKIWHFHRFRYSVNARMFRGAELGLRNDGTLSLGNCIKIGKNTDISSNGGNIMIGNNVGISANNRIVSLDSITIGDGTILAPSVMIYDHDHKFAKNKGIKYREFDTAPIIIGKNCWIGTNTVILRGTVIGDNCVIGAGCVIKGNIPANSIVVQKRNTHISEMRE